MRISHPFFHLSKSSPVHLLNNFGVTTFCWVRLLLPDIALCIQVRATNAAAADWSKPDGDPGFLYKYWNIHKFNMKKETWPIQARSLDRLEAVTIGRRANYKNKYEQK
jgi:hypothetical protein